MCFSPYSISTALAMTYGGARGETAKQMAQTLHFIQPPDQLHPAFAALVADFNAAQKKGEIQLAVANSLWPQHGFAFLPDYLALCRQYYGTSITPVDYRKDAEAARKTINDWVEAETNRKIVELLKSGMVNDLTRLALVNAIYFKGKWARQFDSKLTVEQPFHLSPKEQVTAPLMRQTDDFKYAEFTGLQVVELPYLGDDLAMVVLLPREADGLDHLERRTDERRIWPCGQRTCRVKKWRCFSRSSRSPPNFPRHKPWLLWVCRMRLVHLWLTFPAWMAGRICLSARSFTRRSWMLMRKELKPPQPRQF